MSRAYPYFEYFIQMEYKPWFAHLFKWFAHSHSNANQDLQNIQMNVHGALPQIPPVSL